MHTPRIYLPQPLTTGEPFLLEAQAAHHLATVLRVKKGRELVVFNGEGGEYRGRVIEVDRKKVSVLLEQFIGVDRQSTLPIHIGACLIKFDRMDWLIQKATELGAYSLTPIISDYTDIKFPADKREKKQAHWQQVMINACEQSKRTALMRIHEPVALEDWVREQRSELKLILHPSTSVLLKEQKPQDVALLIGPEGGFSEAEVDWACRQGFMATGLGPRILRAETAPLAAISVLQHLWGDF